MKRGFPLTRKSIRFRLICTKAQATIRSGCTRPKDDIFALPTLQRSVLFLEEEQALVVGCEWHVMVPLYMLDSASFYGRKSALHSPVGADINPWDLTIWEVHIIKPW